MNNKLRPNRQEMLHILQQQIKPISRYETVDVTNLAGRIAAYDIKAIHSLPNTNTAAMDGIAIRFDSLQGAAAATGTWQEGRDFVFANTGCEVAPQYDTVIKIENVSFDSNNRPLLHYLPRQKGELLHHPGTQVVQDELLACAGEMLTPSLVGIMASGGITTAQVLAKPRVTFIPTGDELEPIGHLPLPQGKQIDSNSLLCGAQVKEWGGEYKSTPIIADKKEAIRQAVLAAAASSDLVLICAGSAKGTHDYTLAVLSEIGEMIVPELRHGPGKQFSLYKVNNVPVIGLPGPPHGTDLISQLYVRPTLKLLQGQPLPQPYYVNAQLTAALDKRDMDFVVRLRLFTNNGQMMAKPINTFILTRAAAYQQMNSLYYLEKGSSHNAGEIIPIELTVAPEYIAAEGGADNGK